MSFAISPTFASFLKQYDSKLTQHFVLSAYQLPQLLSGPADVPTREDQQPDYWCDQQRRLALNMALSADSVLPSVQNL